MDIKNDLKNSVKLAADAASDVVQALVEKSRLRANANRIKQVIKGDSEIRNQAYIELGRYFYENMRDSAQAEQEALCVVVDKTTHRIDKASKKYVELVAKSNDLKLGGENTDKIKQAVSDKASQVKEKTKETAQKANDKVTDISDKAKIKAQDLTQKAKETVADITYKAKDKVDDVRAFIATDEDIEAMISEQDEVIENARAEEVKEERTPVEIADDEESPEDFDF